MISNRNEIGKLLTHLNYNKGAEIGVWQGDFAKTILSNWSGHLTLVDPWKHLDDYIDSSNVSNESHEINYNKTIEKLNEFSNRYSIIRDLSVNAVKLFNDEYFDFVYIDANHSYESCYEDISLWIKKIKKGGLICGHDYTNKHTRHTVFGVKDAVKNFFQKDPDIITKDGRCKSWYMFL